MIGPRFINGNDWRIEMKISDLGPAPMLSKAGTVRVGLGRKLEPPLVDCRVISEDYYQAMLKIINEQEYIISEIKELTTNGEE